MSRKIILIKQELLLLVYELNRSGLLAENEKIRPILAQLEKLLLCDLSPSTNTIPLTLSNLKLLRRITRTENILHRNFTRRQVAIQNRVASNIGINQSTFSV